MNNHPLSRDVTRYPDEPDIESSTADYASRFASPVGQWLLARQHELTRQALAERFPGQRGLSVLDVGGGDGQNIALMEELGHTLDIVGSRDICARLIQADIDAGRVRFHASPLLDLPFENRSFDVVMCYRILSHMQSYDELITELSRVSRSLVLVDYPGMRSFNALSGQLFQIKLSIEKNTRRYVCYRDRDIDKPFADAGYKRVFDKRQFALPMALYRSLGSLTAVRFTAAVFEHDLTRSILGSPIIAGFVPVI